jgi:hypothetical protein
MARVKPNYSDATRKEAYDFLVNTGQKVRPFESYKPTNRSLVERVKKQLSTRLKQPVSSRKLTDAIKTVVKRDRQKQKRVQSKLLLETVRTSNREQPNWREIDSRILLTKGQNKIYVTFQAGATDGIDRLAIFPEWLDRLIAEQGERFNRAQLVLRGAAYKYEEQIVYFSGEVYSIETLQEGLKSLSSEMLWADTLIVHMRRVENV